MRITEPYTIFLRTLPSGKQVYYYQYRDEYGRRSPAYSCGTDKLSQARRLCQKLYNEGKFSSSSELLFKTFSEGFFDADSNFVEWKKISDKELAPSTIASYKRLLENQILPYFGEMRLKSISTDTVKQWIIWLKDKCSSKTSNNAQSVLNIILKSAKEKKIISEVPSANISFRKIQKKQRLLLTVEELHNIYNADWHWDSARYAFLTCALTGMRIGEITALQREDVTENCINVEHNLHPVFGIGQTKTRVNRFVPIPKGLDLISKRGSKWVFQKPTSEEPVSQAYIYKRFIAICESLGIDTKARGITVHSLRNFFISYMRGSSFGTTIDLKVKAVVGHADDSQTDWYTYWSPDMFPEIYEIQDKLFSEITGGNFENK